MELNEVEKYEEFLLDSFTTELQERKIKLSMKEINFITNKYPEVSLKKWLNKTYLVNNKK